MGLTTKEISSSSFNDMISSVDRRSEYVENRAGANVRLNNFLTPYTLDDKSSILNAPCGYSNGVYPSLRPIQTFGPELVTNGSFDTDSDWDKGIGWTISGNAANFTYSTPSSLIQDLTVTSGLRYLIEYEIVSNSGVSLKGGGNSFFNVGSSIPTTVGLHSFYVTAVNSLGIDFRYLSGSGSLSVTNISVKEVTDADFQFSRGSSATRVNEKGLIEDVQILSGELVQNGNFEQIGSELVTNGNFANGTTGWTTGNSGVLSIVDGSLVVTGDGGSFASAKQVITGVVGKTYKLTGKVAVVSGSYNVRVEANQPSWLNLFTTSSTDFVNFVAYFVCVNTSIDLRFTIFNATTTSSDKIKIDNVSVKEVGQDWSFNNGASMGDGVATIIGDGSAFGYVEQVGTFVSGKKYKVTLDAIINSGGGLVVKYGLPFASNIGSITTSGSYTFYYTAATSGSIIIGRSTSGVAYNSSIDNVSVIEITDDTDLPRIDYTNGTGALLLEPQRSNSAVNSEFMDGISAPLIIQSSGFSILNNSENSPEGLTNAMKWTEGTNNGTHWGSLILTSALVGQPVSISIFAKRGTSNDRDLVINIYDGSTSDRVHFNLSNGTIYSDGTTNLAVTSMIDYGNGWYRCIYTRTILSSGFNSVMGITNNNDEAYLGNGTSNIFAYGLQIELNADYATSYIPTNGSTVTRNADLCNNAGSSDLINSTEGVLYFEGSALADDGTNRYLSLDDGTTSNYIYFRYVSTSNNVLFRTVIANVTINTLTVVLSDTTQNHKFAYKWKSGDYALWVDGVEISTDLSATTFPSNTLNNLGFNFPTSTGGFYANTKCVAVFKEALTDEELAKITSTTQQEAFYEMRDKMLQINADYYEFGDYTTRLKKLF